MKRFDKVLFVDTVARYERREIDEKEAGRILGVEKRIFLRRYHQYKEPEKYGEIDPLVFEVVNPVRMAVREAKDLPKLEF